MFRMALGVFTALAALVLHPAGPASARSVPTDRPHHFIVSADGTVHGYLDKASYLAAKTALRADSVRAGFSRGRPYVPAQFWEDAFYRGESFTLNRRESDPNIGLRLLHCEPFWVNCQNWNDRISSIITGDNSVTVMADNDFAGDEITYEPHSSSRQLWEWNDRISSIVVE